MNLVWHIVRKDAQLIRGPWLAWMAVQVLGFVVAGQIGFQLEGHGLSSIGLAGLFTVLNIAGWAGLYFFAVYPLHDDPVSGAAAGWVTRPVSPIQLLAAKMIGLALFFWIPLVLVRLPWWWIHGYNLAEIGWASWETLVLGIAVSVFAFWLGTLTSDAGRYYRLTLVVFVAGAALLVMAMVISRKSLIVRIDGLTAVVLLLVMAALAIHQVLTRRTRRSLMIGVGALAVVVLLSPAGEPALRPDAGSYAVAKRAAETALQPGGELSPDLLMVKISVGDGMKHGSGWMEVARVVDDPETNRITVVLHERRSEMQIAPLSVRGTHEYAYLIETIVGAEHLSQQQVTSMRAGTVTFRRVVLHLPRDMVAATGLSHATRRLISAKLPTPESP